MTPTVRGRRSGGYERWEQMPAPDTPEQRARCEHFVAVMGAKGYATLIVGTDGTVSAVARTPEHEET